MVQKRGISLVRDVVMFFGGLAGMAHETALASEPRYILICGFLLMMGVPLPTILKLDAARQQQEESK